MMNGEVTKRTLVAPMERPVEAVVVIPLDAGAEIDIPTDAMFLGWADDVDPLEVVVNETTGKLALKVGGIEDD